MVAGRCRAQLTKVGAESYAARLTLEAKKDVKVGKSEMMESLDKLIRFIGILLVPMGLLRIGRSIKFHHHHRISLQRCRDHRQRPAGGILPPIRLGPVADICITEGLPGSAGEP